MILNILHNSLRARERARAHARLFPFLYRILKIQLSS